MRRFLKSLNPVKNTCTTEDSSAIDDNLGPATDCETPADIRRARPRAYLPEKVGLNVAVQDINDTSFDDFHVTPAGHYLLKSAFTDRSGKKLGEEEVHVFEITAEGRVVSEQRSGQLVFSNTGNSKSFGRGLREEGRVLKQSKACQRALSMAFRKKDKAEARLERQCRELIALECELKETLLAIKQTKRHLEAVTTEQKAMETKLSLILQHEAAKLEVHVRKISPNSFEKYDRLKTSAEVVEFLKDVTKKGKVLDQLESLARRKYLTLRIQEKEDVKEHSGKLPKAVKKKKKVHAVKGRRSGEDAMETLLSVQDARRRGEIRQTMETEL